MKDGLAGLLLPEIVRAAGQRTTGRTVIALEQMIWAPPCSRQRPCPILGGDHPLRRARSAPRSFRRIADRAHAISVQSSSTRRHERSGLACSCVDERRLAAEGRDVTSLWARFAAAGEGSANRRGLGPPARRRSRRGSYGMQQGNHPRRSRFCLHLVWRLIAFSEINGHVPAPTVPFALERYIASSPPAQEMIVRIRHADGAVTVAVHTRCRRPSSADGRTDRARASGHGRNRSTSRNAKEMRL